MSELKKCPFCGGTDAIVINPRLRSCFETLENAIMRVACPDCGAGISFGYLNERWDELTEEHAKEAIRATISAWNRRAQPENEPLTNADRIRGMSDEELAAIIAADFTEEKLNYCQNKPECSAILETADGIISDEWCIQCALDWLKAETEGTE